MSLKGSLLDGQSSWHYWQNDYFVGKLKGVNQHGQFKKRAEPQLAEGGCESGLGRKAIQGGLEFQAVEVELALSYGQRPSNV